MFLPSRKRLRGLLLLFLLLYAGFTLIPAGVYGASRLPAAESSVSQEEALSSQAPSPSPSPSALPGFLEDLSLSTPAPEEDAFTIYDTATGSTLEVPAEEFLPAALACEMDLSAPEEALKAQTVALYTFYSYQRAHSSGEGADFACDTANWLVYVPQSAMEQRWGEDFSSYYETLQAIAASVKGQVLTWEGEPICAAFFAISGGATETAGNVWTEDLPYLQAVASPGDCLANGYLSTVTLTAEELKAAAEAAWPGEISLEGPVEDWISQVDVSPSGYVTSALVGGRTCTGEELREAFGLRSACFTLDTSQGVFQFSVHGWGHGVGMSQAGAAFLANQGASYEEILAYYYPGATLEGAG